MEEQRIKISLTHTYSLEADVIKNRIYFCIHERWDEKTKLEDYLADWKNAISYLQPNFTIISDIRTMVPHSVSIEKVHEQAQKYLIENGLYKVAQVYPKNDITDFQATRVAGRLNLPVNKFFTIEEAESYLDRLVEKLE